MKARKYGVTTPLATFGALALLVLVSAALHAQDAKFHDAPASAKQLKNPYEGQQVTEEAKPLFHLRCARCHGENGEGSGNIPPLDAGKIKATPSGELYWFITKGDDKSGMPSWAKLPSKQRWLIVTYAKTLGTPQSKVASAYAAGGRRRRRYAKGSSPTAAVHRLPFGSPGKNPQDHIERSAGAFCHSIGGQWPQGGGAS